MSLPSKLSPVDAHPFDRATEDILRVRQSAKWKVFPDDVLPLWVAEMDYPIAEPIKRVLHAAIDADDAGYADPRGLGDAFAPWAKRRWAWPGLVPSDVHVAPDVVTAIAELLLVTTKPGDGVVIDPPVYPPFAATIRRLERSLVETPLRRSGTTAGSGWALDLDAIERAYAAGARVHVLCSPQNPTGTVHPRADLTRVAELAARHGVLVLSDEIHAPLTHPGETHHPFPTVSDDAARTSIVLSSASKTFNLAGLKACVIVACHESPRSVVAKLPPDLPYHAGHLGVLGARAAFEQGDAWLAQAMEILGRNRLLLADLLAEHLPRIRYRPPAAGYLAWLDFTDLGLEMEPDRLLLERGRVALSSGLSFGSGGASFARLNLATTRGVLEEAVRRMAHALR